MHMADALVSPAVGATMWAASAGLIVYSSRKVQQETDDSRVPLMGVTAAFVFAAQMVNFAIPGTGSSGHLGGGLLMAAILGSHAGFLAMASVLTVQALLFADGGLLALGANIFNLGFFPCFIAWPLIFRPLLAAGASRPRLVTASVLAALAGLQLGALAVVMQTVASGITELSFGRFSLLMAPIHLPIGLVEGVATAAVLVFVRKARPEVLERNGAAALSRKKVAAGLLAVALATGASAGWFASSRPDGLEWAIEKAGGVAAPPTAVFPWSPLDAGVSLEGVTGVLVTLLLAAALAGAMGRKRVERETGD